MWGAPLWQYWKFLGKRRKAKRLRELSEHVRGGGDTPDKITAASQAVLGEAQQSLPWPRPPKAVSVPWSSASASHGAGAVNKRLIIQETLEQDDEIFLLLQSPWATGQTSQA